MNTQKPFRSNGLASPVLAPKHNLEKQTREVRCHVTSSSVNPDFDVPRNDLHTRKRTIQLQHQLSPPCSSNALPSLLRAEQQYRPSSNAASRALSCAVRLSPVLPGPQSNSPSRRSSTSEQLQCWKDKEVRRYITQSEASASTAKL